MKNLMILLLVGIIALTTVAAAPGDIWLTVGSCGPKQDKENFYSVGDTIFINGRNFNFPNSYAWQIVGQPGRASCDPGFEVASGIQYVGNSGEICFEAYTVQPDDCGEYKANFGGKNQNYRIPGEPIPEFGAIAVGATIILALAGFLIVRRQ